MEGTGAGDGDIDEVLRSSLNIHLPSLSPYMNDLTDEQEVQEARRPRANTFSSPVLIPSNNNLLKTPNFAASFPNHRTNYAPPPPPFYTEPTNLQPPQPINLQPLQPINLQPLQPINQDPLQPTASGPPRPQLQAPPDDESQNVDPPKKPSRTRRKAVLQAKCGGCKLMFALGSDAYIGHIKKDHCLSAADAIKWMLKKQRENSIAKKAVKEKVLGCPICCQPCASNEAAKQCKASHAGEIIQFRCLIENCPRFQKLFKNKRTYYGHLREKHSMIIKETAEKTTHTCQSCGIKCSSVFNLSRHIQRYHKEAELEDVGDLEEGALELSRESFAEIIIPKDLAMVLFFAPGSSHCKTMKKDYEKAAKELRKGDVFLGKVDASKNKELADEYNVEGYPTIMLYRKGIKVETYAGGRTSEELITYMRQNLEINWQPIPSVVEKLTTENFTKTAKASKLMLVMFYAPWSLQCKQLEPEFEKAALELEDWDIKLSKVDGASEKDLADQFNIEKWPLLKMFRKGRVFDFNGPKESEGLINYLKEQSKPPSDLISTFKDIQCSKFDPTVIGVFAGLTDMYEEFIVAANKMRGTFKFMHTNDVEIARNSKFAPDTVLVFNPLVNYTYSLPIKHPSAQEIMIFIKNSSFQQEEVSSEVSQASNAPASVSNPISNSQGSGSSYDSTEGLLSQ